MDHEQELSPRGPLCIHLRQLLDRKQETDSEAWNAVRSRRALRQLTSRKPGLGRAGLQPGLSWGVGAGVALSTSAPATLRLPRLHSGSESWETACYWLRRQGEAGQAPTIPSLAGRAAQHASGPFSCILGSPLHGTQSRPVSLPRALPRHSHQRRHNRAELPAGGVSTRRPACQPCRPLNVPPSTR